LALINPLNAELNPIYHLLALLGAHHIFHVSGLRVNTVHKRVIFLSYFATVSTIRKTLVSLLCGISQLYRCLCGWYTQLNSFGYFIIVNYTQKIKEF